MKSNARKVLGICLLFFLFVPQGAGAAGKKGLLVHNSVYGSTIETAYWVKALIGYENKLDVMALPQVITIEPYDYVIIGSLTRDEKPTEDVYAFVERFRKELSQKQVCYYLTCGDTDETMILNIPGKKAHLIGGRNYLFDILETIPEVKPVVIGGFGGRQVMPTLNTSDSFRVWLVGKLAKEGAAWEGLDIWESLVPQRVEAFANEVRGKILGLGPREDAEQFRHFWQTLQPASLDDPAKKKYNPRKYTEHHSTDKILYVRSRMPGDLAAGKALIETWSKVHGFSLKEQKSTFYNTYYHAVKKYDAGELALHVVAATLPEDPGNVHFSFRNYDKPDKREKLEKDLQKARERINASGTVAE